MLNQSIVGVNDSGVGGNSQTHTYGMQLESVHQFQLYPFKDNSPLFFIEYVILHTLQNCDSWNMPTNYKHQIILWFGSGKYV